MSPKNIGSDLQDLLRRGGHIYEVFFEGQTYEFISFGDDEALEIINYFSFLAFLKFASYPVCLSITVENQ